MGGCVGDYLGGTEIERGWFLVDLEEERGEEEVYSDALENCGDGLHGLTDHGFA